jgi:hypothetical protein
MPIIPVPGKWRQENLEFEASLGYIVIVFQKPKFKKKQKQKNPKMLT